MMQLAGLMKDKMEPWWRTCHDTHAHTVAQTCLISARPLQATASPPTPAPRASPAAPATPAAATAYARPLPGSPTSTHPAHQPAPTPPTAGSAASRMPRPPSPARAAGWSRCCHYSALPPPPHLRYSHCCHCCCFLSCRFSTPRSLSVSFVCCHWLRVAWRLLWCWGLRLAHCLTRRAAGLIRAS